MRDDLLIFVRAHHWATVSTVSPSGHPQAAIVRIVVTDAFELIFDTTDTTRKAANLRYNGKIAVVVGWEDNQTVQIEGVADEPGGQELQSFRQFYSTLHPDYFRTRQGVKGLIYFRVSPKWMRYSDFRKNPASVFTLDFATGEENRVMVPFRSDV